MRRVLVTGATGAVGAPLAGQLAGQGAEVRCLVRDPAAAQAALPQADLIGGDLEDPAALARAVSGCDAVFHAGGMPEQWTRDPGIFHRVNCEGTGHLLQAAQAAGTRLFVHVSTQDTFDLTRDPFDETMPSRDPYPSAYEASKLAAQALVDRAGAEGMAVRSIHPSAVYGPGALKPSGMNALLLGLRRGQVPALIRGGMPVVFNANVARGAILAAERGRNGSKFILAESYQTLRQMAAAVHQLFPDAKVPGEMPDWLATLLAAVSEPLSRLTGKRPLMTRGELGVMRRTGRPSAAAARKELGWEPVPFATGLRQMLLG